MGDDLTKKQRPSDDSQDKGDKFGMEEYGYDPDDKKKDEVDKRKEDDDNDDNNNKDAKSCEEDEENRKRLDDLEQLGKMREERKARDLRILKEREEKKEGEKKKKEKQWEESDETEKKERFIAKEKVKEKRVFTHKKEEGVFRHKKLVNFDTKGLKKIGKRFKKVHGISSEKKRKFLNLLKAYNPSKSMLTRKSFDDFSKRFKSKRFTGHNFNRMKKEGIDLRDARKKFGKGDLDRLRRGIIGEKDSHKHQMKSLNRSGLSPRGSSSGITVRKR